MPETPEQLYERSNDALRMPEVEEWETFPFEGEMRPWALLPPDAAEPPRHGEGGIECWACDTPDGTFIWTSERWRLASTPEPPGLPHAVRATKQFSMLLTLSKPTAKLPGFASGSLSSFATV